MAYDGHILVRRRGAPSPILAAPIYCSAQAAGLCPNRGAGMSDTREVIRHRSDDPHTAVPDWVPFIRGIGPEARNVIVATLVLQKSGEPPTRRQLAHALGVDERSVYRWMREIAAAGAMSTRRVGRFRECVFHKPIPDRMITDRTITDHMITDHVVRYRTLYESVTAASGSRKVTIPDHMISDPPVVGVGDHVIGEKKPTTTTRRAPLKTPLARWAKQYGMVAARELDDPSLDYATYKRWIEDHRAMGWEWRQIVSTLRDAPLESPPRPTPATESTDAGDAGDMATPADAGDLAEIDSTSRQLARRFESDRAEAQARAAGLLDVREKLL
jgi:hypothetical protein